LCKKFCESPPCFSLKKELIEILFHRRLVVRAEKELGCQIKKNKKANLAVSSFKKAKCSKIKKDQLKANFHQKFDKK